MLGDTSTDYLAHLEKIYKEFQIDAYNDTRYLEALDTLEYLNSEHKTLFMNYSSAKRPKDEEINKYLERFLAYLIYRHATEADDGEDFRSRLSFSLFCERLLASLICRTGAKTLGDVSKLVSIISEEIEYSSDNTWSLTYFD